MYSGTVEDQRSGGNLVFSRRPVLDRNLRTVGFELLLADDSRRQEQWRELVPAVQPIYLPVTRGCLVEGGPPALEPAGIKLMLAHDGPVDAALLTDLQAARERGFEIVLQAARESSQLASLLPFVHAVKLDVRACGEQPALAELSWLKEHGVTVLMAGVQTEDTFNALRGGGADLFQGLFYERPNLVVRRPAPLGHTAALSALLDEGSAEREFDRLEELIRRDAGLSYRLLWYANSAFVAAPRPVSSVREALVRLGSRTVRQWALALVLSGLEDRPHALLSSALVRARTCELLVGSYAPDRAERGFTTGLFSLLDALLGAPMEEVLSELPLCDEVVAAILRREGVAGKALEKVIAYERGFFEDAALTGHARTVLAISYLDAIRWADGLI